jgi:hypothetical protein
VVKENANVIILASFEANMDVYLSNQILLFGEFGILHERRLLEHDTAATTGTLFDDI